jgi:hypothetical protein
MIQDSVNPMRWYASSIKEKNCFISYLCIILGQTIDYSYKNVGTLNKNRIQWWIDYPSDLLVIYLLDDNSKYIDEFHKIWQSDD